MIDAAKAELGPRFNLEGTRPRRPRHRRLRGQDHATCWAAGRDALERSSTAAPTTANVREQQAPRRRSARPPVRTDPPGRGGCALGVEPPAPTRAAWSASSRRRAACRTICCCPIASSSTSAAARCSTCSTRRTRATTSRPRPRRARLAKLYAQYRVLAATNRLIEALGVHDADRGVERRARRASGSIRSRRRTGRKTASRIRRWARPRRHGTGAASSRPADRRRRREQ